MTTGRINQITIFKSDRVSSQTR